jgi:hypothetical protein
VETGKGVNISELLNQPVADASAIPLLMQNYGHKLLSLAINSLAVIPINQDAADES